MKIVINTCYGGFGLSKDATLWLIERGHQGAANYKAALEESESSFAPYLLDQLTYRPENRADALVIECVETLLDAADGRCAKLKIIEIPDEVEWEIEEYDGVEWVAEKHRTWR